MTSAKNSGGGVLIAVHNNITNEQFQLSSQDIEQLCVTTTVMNKKMYIYVAYIPPHSTSEIYMKCSESIAEIYNATDASDILLVTGDFNLTNINWVYDTDINTLLPVNINSESECLFIDNVLNLNLSQINNIPNNRGRFLDIILTNEPELFNICESVNPFVVNDINHKSLEISFEFNEFSMNKSNQSGSEWSYNFSKANHENLGHYFSTIKWDEMFGTDDLNIDVEKFYDIIFIGFDRHIPISKKQQNIHPPWYDDKLINLKNIKNKYYVKMKKSQSEEDRNAFIQSFKKFDLYFNQRYKTYISKIQEKIKTNPKHFWSFFNSKRDVKGYPSTMQFNGSKSSESSEIANYFAKFFQSVYKAEDITEYIIPSGNNGNLKIDLPTFTEDEIMSALLGFGDGCGPDGVPSSILKSFANELKKPLCFLFNKSLTTGIFPSKWKTTRITPIFKSGSRSDVSCYRGIATASSIPKLLEFMVCNSFKNTVPRHLSVHQHGFMPGRSTSTNLVEFTSKTIKALENHIQVDAVYTDFSKAFDSISHCKALESLFNFGFSNQFVSWFNSYLTNRQQYVEVIGKQSKLISVTSGVPQGSHVGPWLFIIFIDGATSVIQHSQILVYADDLKIYRTVENSADTNLIQDDVNRLSEWCQANHLHLNISKCKVMSFHRKSSPIINDYHIDNTSLQRVVETKDLGVTFVVNMTFNKHMDLSIAKANAMLGFIKRWTHDISDENTLLILYFAYVRSQLEYAVPVWCPYYASYISRIESVQKKFLLFILRKKDWDYDEDLPYYENVKRLPPYKTRCQNYNITSLETRRQLLGSSFIANTLLGYIDSPYILENINLHAPNRKLRHHRLLQLDVHRTVYGENEPINHMADFFNAVDHLFDFGISKENYKKRLKEHFLTNDNQ